MQLRKLRKNLHANDHLTGITPIYKVSFSGKVELIGTGFWVTERGHFITAWHVIQDNIGTDGVDTGPIYAMCMTPERRFMPRALRKSYQDKIYDLALCETIGPNDLDGRVTRPLKMTLDEPSVGETIFTHAFVSCEQTFTEDKSPGLTTSEFNATLAIPEMKLEFDLCIRTRLETGTVQTIYPEKRDSVMAPFPCYQSEMMVYGANSGGPVFDKEGRICGVNFTSVEGTDISFHIPMKGILDLWARKIAFVPEDPIPRGRTVIEMGLAKRVWFDPPLKAAFFDRRERLILSVWHTLLFLANWIRWLLFEKSFPPDRLEDHQSND